MENVEKYNEIKPLYELFTESLISLLKSILEEKRIKFHLIEGRTKDVKSFKSKIESKKGKYQDPLKEIMDLSGIRIIVYYQTDIDIVDALIKENFKVDEENSVNKNTILGSNEFGYLSSHYIIKINTDRIKLPEWKKYKCLCAEIQLRTVLQHSWAAISHELDYKNKFDIPEILKRKLFRLAGLFELADEQFVDLKNRQIELSKAIKNNEKVENFEVFNEINFDTVKNYLENNNQIIESILDSGLKAGFKRVIAYNKDLDLSYSIIVNLLKLQNIETITEFNSFLSQANKYAYKYLNLQIKAQKETSHDNWLSDGLFLIILILMANLSEVELLKFNPIGWSKQILERVKTTIINWKQLYPTIIL